MKTNVEEQYIGRRLDVVVHDVLKDLIGESLTRTLVQENLENGCRINGNICKKSYKLRDGDILEVDEQYWEDLKKNLDLSDGIAPQKGDLDIRYEDNDLLVIYKAKGIVVHPGVGNSKNTLANYLRYYLEDKGEYDFLMDRSGIVHRLDKGVSGLMVVAKNKITQEYLKSQFQEHKVVKIYHAYVEEVGMCKDEMFKQSEQNIDVKKYLSELDISFEPWKSWYNMRGYIGRSSKNRYKMEFKQYAFGGSKSAQSYILKSGNQVLVKIETGRMHQIRCSLEYLGLHILGDTLYGTNKKEIKSSNEIMLESMILSFEKENGERLTFKV